MICTLCATDWEDNQSEIMYHGKYERNRPDPVRDQVRQQSTRTPVSRGHGNYGASGYLPGAPRQSEPRMHRAPNPQRHWEDVEVVLKTKHPTVKGIFSCWFELEYIFDSFSVRLWNVLYLLGESLFFISRKDSYMCKELIDSLTLTIKHATWKAQGESWLLNTQLSG